MSLKKLADTGPAIEEHRVKSCLLPISFNDAANPRQRKSHVPRNLCKTVKIMGSDTIYRNYLFLLNYFSKRKIDTLLVPTQTTCWWRITKSGGDWRNGTTHIVLTPMEFMQRLAALVPRPRLHLIL